MTTLLTPEQVLEKYQKMTLEERKDLASRMLNPLRCGGSGYENGKRYLILGGQKRFAKEVNHIIREMNPKWSDEELKPYFVDEDK